MSWWPFFNIFTQYFPVGNTVGDKDRSGTFSGLRNNKSQVWPEKSLHERTTQIASILANTLLAFRNFKGNFAWESIHHYYGKETGYLEQTQKMAGNRRITTLRELMLRFLRDHLPGREKSSMNSFSGNCAARCDSLNTWLKKKPSGTSPRTTL